jgi:hypothetical protein
MSVLTLWEKRWSGPKLLDNGGAVYNVQHRRFGAKGDGVTDDTAAFLALEAAGDHGFIPAGTYRIATNLTLSKTWTFANGAKLKPASGVTVTISDSPDAGLYQIFDLSAGGAVVGAGLGRVKPQWFGALGDGVTDDAAAVQAAANAVKAAGGVLFFPAGTYLLGASIGLGGLTKDLVIAGAGLGLVKIKRKDGTVTADFQGVFGIGNATGSSVRVTTRDLYIDQNARGNPLTDTNGDGIPDNEYEFQHAHAIGITPTGARGILEARVENVTIFDPIADGVSFSGTTANTYGSIFCSRVQVSDRARVRSDVTITGSFDHAVLSDLILDTLEVETNGTAADHKHALAISNVHCRKNADIYCKGLAAAGITAPAVISNLTVEGFVIFGEWEGEISNSRFLLSSRCRFLLGRWRFHGCTFRATASQTSGLLYVEDNAAADAMEFHGCRFELAAAVTLDYYLFRAYGTGSVRRVACYDCEFTGQAAASFSRAGVQIFKGCSFEYAGVQIVQGLLDPAFTANRVELRDNLVLDAAGWLYQPAEGTQAPCDIWMKGNISRTPFQTLKLLRITNVNGRGGSGASLTFHSLDNHETDISPTNTTTFRLRGERQYLVNPAAGGKIGGVCVAAGAPGTWKAFGPIDA